jgi:hypothetical protein
MGVADDAFVEPGEDAGASRFVRSEVDGQRIVEEGAGEHLTSLPVLGGQELRCP